METANNNNNNNNARISYIIAMFKAMEFSFSASFNMLALYMPEKEAMNLLIKTKKELAK
jgi:hypothetical protein